MKIDRDEMLRYMGVRGSGEGVDAKALAEAESLCLAAAVPKSVVKEYEFDCKTMNVVGTNVFSAEMTLRVTCKGAREFFCWRPRWEWA